MASFRPSCSRITQSSWLVSSFSHALCRITLIGLLLAACGISTAASGAQSMGRRGHGRKTSVLVDPSTLAGPFLNLLSNPFSLTVLFFSAALTFASIFMPPFQVAALDKVLAGLESAAMCYVAWPASKALGKVLLQTAPPSYQAQNVQLSHALKRVSCFEKLRAEAMLILSTRSGRGAPARHVHCAAASVAAHASNVSARSARLWRGSTCESGQRRAARSARRKGRSPRSYGASLPQARSQRRRRAQHYAMGVAVGCACPWCCGGPCARREFEGQLEGRRVGRGV